MGLSSFRLEPGRIFPPMRAFKDGSSGQVSVFNVKIDFSLRVIEWYHPPFSAGLCTLIYYITRNRKIIWVILEKNPKKPLFKPGFDLSA